MSTLRCRVLLVLLAIWTLLGGLIYCRSAIDYVSTRNTAAIKPDALPRVIHIADTVAAARTIKSEEGRSTPLLSSRPQQETPPSSDTQCNPRPWLTAFRSNCNDVHSLDNRDKLVRSARTNHRQGLVHIFPNGGARVAGRLILENDDAQVVFKVQRFEKPIDSTRIRSYRLEALILEQLNSSADIYGYCGTSSISEYGEGGALCNIVRKAASVEKLEYAVDISRSLAELNSMGIIARDVKESNFALFRDGRIKQIDLNQAIPVLWNETTKLPCYPSNVTYPPRLELVAPERIEKGVLTEKVDTYGLGTVLFYILANTKVYNCKMPRRVLCIRDNTISENELRAIKRNGTLPTLPVEIEDSNDPAVCIIRDTMKQALQTDVGKRPSTNDVSKKLEKFLDSLHNNTAEEVEPPKTIASSCELQKAEREIVPEPTYVATYPGSGSELTLNLIEALTGVKTASNGGKCDIPEIPYNYVALKTHYPWNCKESHQHSVFSRVVVLIRNPMFALPSKANRDYETDQRVRSHTTQASKEFWTKWRDKHFRVNLALWEELIHYWIDNHNASDRIVLPYEQLVSEETGPRLTQDLSRHLNNKGGNISVADEDVVNCIWQRVVVEDNSRRRPNTHRKKVYQPSFTYWQLEEIDRVLSRLATQYANMSFGQVFAEYGQEVQVRQHDPETPEIAWLVSYPNSYNTAIRRLLQVVTNTTGATNYGKERINIDGTHSFNSTSVPVFSGDTNGPFRICNDLPLPDGGFVLTKTHCGIDGCFECNVAPPDRFLDECTRGYNVSESGKVSRTNYNPDKVKRAVHLLLNPFSNVITRFRGAKSYENTREGFEKWCRDYDDNFLLGSADADLVPGEVLESDVLCHTEFFKYVEWHNNAANVILRQNLPVHILHAEDFVEGRFQDTLADLVDFLGLKKVREGAPFSTANLVNEYFSPDAIREVSRFIKRYASDEVWTILDGRYLSNTGVY